MLRCKTFEGVFTSKHVIILFLVAIIISQAWYFKTITGVLQTYHKVYNIKTPVVNVANINCRRLFENDSVSLSKARFYEVNNYHISIPVEYFTNNASNCTQFYLDRQYITEPLSKEEEVFPIAYSIMMYKDVEQFERLLRAIYHPQNYYCINVDTKVDVATKRTIVAIVNCFENVFIASYVTEINWSDYTVMGLDPFCMADLWKYKKWKYFISLTEQDFPLKTNWEMVQILHGSSDTAGNINGLAISGNVNLTKKSLHISASHDFIDFLLNGERALNIHRSPTDVSRPAEILYKALNYSTDEGVPKAYIYDKDTLTMNSPSTFWFKKPIHDKWPCEVKHIQYVGTIGVEDLPLLSKRREMFANKFNIDCKPLPYACLEEWHFSKLKKEVEGEKHQTQI